MKQILTGKMIQYNDDKYQIQVKQSELDNITKLELDHYEEENGEEFIGLHYFRNLEYLDIQNSTAFHTNDLKTLSNLKYLDISNCVTEDKEYDLSFLMNLKELEYLNTEGTHIKNEDYTDRLENLKEWKN